MPKIDSFYPPDYAKADELAPIIEELSEDIMCTISKALPEDKYVRKEVLINLYDYMGDEIKKLEGGKQCLKLIRKLSEKHLRE